MGKEGRGRKEILEEKGGEVDVERERTERRDRKGKNRKKSYKAGRGRKGRDRKKR